MKRGPWPLFLWHTLKIRAFSFINHKSIYVSLNTRIDIMKPLKLLFALLFVVSLCQAQETESEIEAVKAACLNYINTFYEADTTLAYKSVHPSVRKVGFYFKNDEKTYSPQLEMPFQDLIKLAKSWNADGNQINDTSPKEVTIFEVSDKIASAKVTAVWGIDYLSLRKENDTWMIMNVLWQSPPRFSVSEE